MIILLYHCFFLFIYLVLFHLDVILLVYLIRLKNLLMLYEFWNNLSGKFITTRYKWKRFWCFRFYDLTRTSHITVTSTWNGRCKIIEGATVQKDKVLDHLDLVETNFDYLMKNPCCQSKSDNQTIQYGN